MSPPSALRSGEERSQSILVRRPLHTEPVLTHSCGVQYRNSTPVEISSSINILDPGNPLWALAREFLNGNLCPMRPLPEPSPRTAMKQKNSQRTEAVPELAPLGQGRNKTNAERAPLSS